MTGRIRVYLAGPDVFRPDALAWAARQKAVCLAACVTPVHPLDNEGASDAPAIFRANCAAMRSAQAIVANLSPFRGPAADPGTVFEVGFMHALGRPALGYTTQSGTLLDRLGGAKDPPRFDAEARRWLAADGTTVEDFGLPENLMVACALDAPLLLAAPGDAGQLEALRECLALLRAMSS